MKRVKQVLLWVCIACFLPINAQTVRDYASRFDVNQWRHIDWTSSAPSDVLNATNTSLASYISYQKDWTWETWMRPAFKDGGTSGEGRKLITIEDQRSKSHFHVSYFWDGTKFIFQVKIVGAGGTTTLVKNFDLTGLAVDNNWNHFALVFTKSNTNLELYINGISKYKIAVDPWFNFGYSGACGAKSPILIGGKGGTNSLDNFIGWMTEMRIWNTARTATQINANYPYEIAPTSPEATGLIATLCQTGMWWMKLWDADEVVDCGGSSNNDQLGIFNMSGVNKFMLCDMRYSSQSATPAAYATACSTGYPPIGPSKVSDTNINLRASRGINTNAIIVQWNWADTYQNEAILREIIDGRSDPNVTRNTLVGITFEIYRTDNSDALPSNATNIYSVSRFSNGANSFSWTDTNVADGHKYTYYLKYYWLSGGIKRYGPTTPLTVGNISNKVTPTSVTIDETNPCAWHDSIALNWASTESPQYWEIRYKSTTDSGSVTVNGKLRSAKIKMPRLLTDYSLRIRATGTDDNGNNIALSYPQYYAANKIYQAKRGTTKILSINATYNGSYVVVNFMGDRKQDGFHLFKAKKGEPFTDILINKDSTAYRDANVTTCETYQYKISPYNSECSPWTSSNFSNIVEVSIPSGVSPNAISNFQASKGYYQKYVGLSWKADLTKISRFYIYRILAADNTAGTPADTVLLKVLDNAVTYEDYSALGGVKYEYNLVGYADCGGKSMIVNTLKDIGFYQPYGIVNGRVDYTGGNPVEGVRINFEPATGIRGRSLQLSGMKNYIKTPKSTNNNLTDAYTFESWVKLQNDSSALLWQRFGTNSPTSYLDNRAASCIEVDYSYINPDSIKVRLLTWAIKDQAKTTRNSYYSNYAIVPKDTWLHAAYTYKKNNSSDNSNDSLKMYLNGALIGRLKITDRTTTMFGTTDWVDTYGSLLNPSFKGTFSIDEIRLWNAERTAAEIKTSYGRALNGNEHGLITYYRCDEVSPGETQCYDNSKNGSVFNKNNGQFVVINNSGTGVLSSNDIPSTNQFGICAYTDNTGNYSAAYVPYMGAGESFKVTPSLGQHVFDPPTKNLYIGDGAQTLNNIDFKDKSSFTVTGKVTYLGGTLPVKGVNLYIDGKPAIGTDNKPVVTGGEFNNAGEYAISVPIGYHYITVGKESHVFSKGIFPTQVSKYDINTFEFTKDLTDINFTDSTFIKVAGKVVGGDIQANKPLGLNQTKNNIGRANISFGVKGNETYTLSNSKDTIGVTTNATTGEYEVKLYPEEWEIIAVNVTSNSTLSIEKPGIDLRNAFTYKTDSVPVTKDRITVSGKIITDTTGWNKYKYQFKNNYVYYAPQTILVTNPDGSNFSGEKLLTVTNPSTNANDTILLDNNQLAYPLFQSTHQYTAKIGLFEKYLNKDDGQTIQDSIPVANSTIEINNEFDLVATAEGSAITFKTDENGLANYIFKTGLPNVDSDNLRQNMRIYSSNARWPSAGNLEAYIIGAKPLAGTNFVTSGPDEVDIILRDPPGSKSYAYIEKGSTFSRTRSYSLGQNSDNTASNKLAAGLMVSVGGGLAGPVIKNNVINDSRRGFAYESSSNKSGDYVEKYTFTERYQTSAQPGEEGSMADLFIGKSLNTYFGKSKTLEVVDKNLISKNGLTIRDQAKVLTSKKGIQYQFALNNGFTVNPQGQETFFAYSQSHIVNELLPNLMLLRDNYLLANPKYHSLLKPTHKYYGMNNTDTLNFSTQFKDSMLAVTHNDRKHLIYTYSGSGVDSVALINESIKNWLNILQRNEAEKLEAELVQNVSFDGVSGPRTSELKETHISSTTNSSKKNIRMFSEAVIGNLSNEQAGFQLETTSNMSIGIDETTGKNNEQNLTFGYVLEDGDEGDYYSVDVKKTKGSATVLSSGKLNIAPSADEVETALFSVLGEDVGLNDVVHGSAKAVKTGLKLTKAISKYVGKQTGLTAAKSNYYFSIATFALGTAVQLYDMVQMGISAYDVSEKIKTNEEWDVNGFAISSPIFSVKGGQSKCPYTNAEYSSLVFNSNGGSKLLNTATVQREVPKITVTNPIINNIPSGTSASFTLTLQNNSESESDAWYSLKIDDATNKYGAKLKIDGLDPNRDFFIPYGKPVTKTLTLEMGRADVLNYDSIGVILHSRCQYDPSDNVDDIYDYAFISAHFQPVCSSVAFKGIQDNWLINSNNDNKLSFKIANYDLQNSQLERIVLEYKLPSELESQAHVDKAYFVKAGTAFKAYTGTKDSINNRAEISCDWDVSALSDQSYQIRLKTYCSDGSVYTTPFLTGIIDRSKPQVFGTPSPEDGILSASKDMSIQFNKPIESGLIIKDNIIVETVLNNTPVTHNTSVRFDGTASFATIPTGIDLNNKSFTIEFWAKRNTPARKDVLYQQGTDFEIGFNNEAELYWKLGSETIKGNVSYSTTYKSDSWHHYAFTYNKDTRKAEMYIDDCTNSGEVKHNIEKLNVTMPTVSNGVILIGKQSSGSDKLLGNMHDLRIWTKAKTPNEINAEKSITLIGNELSLYGYWPMDKGKGTLAEDKARSRHMTLNAGWAIEDQGYSYAFSGDKKFLKIDSRNVLINKDMDMTIEFWFKAPVPTTEQCLFSRGKGDKSEGLYMDTLSCMSIFADTSGKIFVQANGNKFEAVTTNYFDNTWHHFALVVNKKSNVKAFIDGKAQNTSSTAAFNALNGSYMALGAEMVYSSQATFTSGKFYKGMLDEVRIWNVARTAQQIETEMNNRLRGVETGLLAYYPFEKYNTTTQVFDQNLTDLAATIPAAENMDNNLAVSTLYYTTESPTIKTARPVTTLSAVANADYSFTVGDDKIVIDLNASTAEKRAKLEGCVLNITVKDIKDKHGNILPSPATWTAFVNKNPLKWKDTELSYEMVDNKPLTFSTKIINSGGTYRNINVSNIPSWLVVSPATTTVAPNSELTINFTVSTDLNYGKYEEVLYLNSDFGFAESLKVKIKSKKTPPLNWTVNNNNFMYSMNVIGKLNINNELSTDEDDIVAVFKNGNCVGLCSPVYNSQLDSYLLFLDVYSNVSSETSSAYDIRVWDASEGVEKSNVTTSQTLNFAENALYGTLTSPVVFSSDNSIRVEKVYPKGWSWVSFNLQNANNSNLNIILKDLAVHDNKIQYQQLFDQYDKLTKIWAGTLSATGGVKCENMYKLLLQRTDTLVYTGYSITAGQAVKLQPGWNWVGYHPRVNMTVNEALSSLHSQPNDIVKSQNAFAVYDTNLGWLGTLKVMEPFKGYMMYTNRTDSLIYPQQTTLAKVKQLAQSVAANSKIAVDYTMHPNNMQLIGEIETDSKTLTTGNELLVATRNGEYAGVAALEKITDKKYIYFLTINGQSNSDAIKLQLNDENDKVLAQINGQFTFNSDVTLGTIDKPYALKISAVNTDFKSMVDNASVSVSPNPFTSKLDVHVFAPVDSDIKYVIFNTLGNRVYENTVQSVDNNHSFSIKPDQLSRGVYFLHIIIDNKTIVKKIVKK